MPCELELSLGPTPPEVRAGDSIDGVLVVRTRESMSGAHIDVYGRLRARGFHPDLVTERQRVLSGAIEAGEQKFPIRIEVPTYPPSYDGTFVGWQWTIEAELSANGALARACADVTVRSSPASRWRLVPEQQGTPGAVDVADTGGWVRRAAGLLAIGSIVLMVQDIASTVASEGGGSMMVLWLISTVLFALLYFKLRAQAKVRRLLGAPQLVIEHDVEAGSLRCNLWTRAPGPPGEVRAELVVREQTVQPKPGRDNAKERIRQVVWQTNATLVRDARGTHTGVLTATPPLLLPPLVDAWDHGLAWLLSVTILDGYGLELARLERRLDGKPDDRRR